MLSFRFLFVVGGVIAASLAACTESRPAQIVLLINSDVPSEEIAKVDVEIRDGSGAIRKRLECGSAFPYSISILSRDENQLLNVTASAVRRTDPKNAPWITSAAEVNFAKNRAQTLHLALNAECANVSCESDRLTCSAGGKCVSVRRSSLPSAEDANFGARTTQCAEVTLPDGEPNPNGSGGRGGTQGGDTGQPSGGTSAGSGGDPAGGTSGSAGAPLDAECKPETVASDCPNLNAPACIAGRCARFPRFAVGNTDALNRAAWEPRLHVVRLGAPSPYSTGADRFNGKIGAISANVMPSGKLSFSEIEYKTTLFSHIAPRFGDQPDLRKDGYRPLDFVGYVESPGRLTHRSLWGKDVSPIQGDFVRDKSAAELTEWLENLEAGAVPIRLHGYFNGTNTVYSAVYQMDPAKRAFRYVLDRTPAQYQSAVAQNQKEGYHPFDLAAYPMGTQVLYSGVFIKDPRVSASQAHIALTREEFDAKRIAYSNLDYLTQDAEWYSTNATVDEPRAAGIWLQFDNPNVEVNANGANLSGQASIALNSLKWTFQETPGRVGFFVQDLTNGHYVSYHAQDAFFMGSGAKLLVAASALNLVDGGQRSLRQLINCTEHDVLTRSNKPAVGGTYKFRELLEFMLTSQSDTAEDVLTRSLLDGLNNYIENRAVNVGEVIGWCSSYKRLLGTRHACIENVSCGELGRLVRDKTPPSAEYATCLANVTEPSASEYAAYFASYANSISPLDLASFWRGILQGSFISRDARDLLLGLLPRQQATDENAYIGQYFTEQLGISSSGYKTESFIGVGYDPDALDGRGATAQYSISWLVKNLPGDTEQEHTEVRRKLKEALADTFVILQSLR